MSEPDVLEVALRVARILAAGGLEALVLATLRLRATGELS